VHVCVCVCVCVCACVCVHSRASASVYECGFLCFVCLFVRVGI